MILPEARIQKRNLFGAGILLLLVVAWIVFTDLSFSNTSTLVLVGLGLGYLGFALFDYRDVMHQIIRPNDPYRRRP
jgi:hypothetical protein